MGMVALALQRLRREISSSRPAWPTWEDPVTNKRADEAVLAGLTLDYPS